VSHLKQPNIFVICRTGQLNFCPVIETAWHESCEMVNSGVEPFSIFSREIAVGWVYNLQLKLSIRKVAPHEVLQLRKN
jgi:hypothetical protein